MPVPADIPGRFNFAAVYDRQVERAPDPAAFVEVGAWLGKSTAYLARRIRDSGKNIALHVVDTWKGSPDEPLHRAELERHGGDLFPAFRDNMTRSGVLDLIRPVQKPSVQAARDFPDLSLSAGAQNRPGMGA